MPTGSATWYCLCHGGDCDNHSGGACGDCYNDSYHIAWPYVYSDDSCGESQYVGGTVTGVRPGQIQLHSYDGNYTLQLSAISQIWKGAWDRNATIEAGDRIDASGTRRPGGYFDVERMWVNIVNLIGPVSNAREGTDSVQFTQRDRFRGPISVVIDRQTAVVSNAQKQMFAPGQLHLAQGKVLQTIGVRFKDGSVHATRVFS